MNSSPAGANPQAQEAAALVVTAALARWFGGEATLRLARAAALLHVDDRVTFTPRDITAIKAQVRNRIFNEGLNDQGRQMQPAKSYPPPRGLYRFLTGELYRSANVTGGDGLLALSFNYDEVVLASLEDRYGPIFGWSPQDVAFVDQMVRDKLRMMGLPPEAEATGRELLEARRAARAAWEAEQLAVAKQAYLAALNDKLGEELPPARRPANAPDAARAEVRTQYLEYDPRAPLGLAEVMAIRDKVVYRIRMQGLNAAGNDIPQALYTAINADTYRSIEVRQAGPGRLLLRVVLRNGDLPALERAHGRVFAWGKHDVRFVDDLVRQRLINDKDQQPTRAL